MGHHEHEGRSERFLDFVDNWRFAAGVAFIALLALMLFSLKLWSDLDSLVEERVAEQVKANEQSVVRCFANATNTPALVRVILALEREATDPQTRHDLEAFRRLSVANAPTLRECRQLADDLGVTERGP